MRRFIHFKIALAVLVVASVPLQLTADAGRSSSEALTTKEVRRAEREARTAADHLRLAAYYRSKARQAQANLTEEEEQMKYWGWMADRTKIPNPYWSARALTGMYRADLKKALKLAADHQRIAESLEAKAVATQ
ncbi:MAG: hypothetical protein ABSG41_20250 [Bryobacteraceae bacterium]|jgi:hypothetical protein